MKKTYSLAMVIMVTLAVLPVVGAAEDLNSYLREKLALSDSDINDLVGGKIISVIVDSKDKREVAVVGVARTKVTSEFLLASFPDFVAIRDQKGVLGVGQISQPPLQSDFDEVLLPQDDLKDLMSCKAGKCNVKLTQPAFDYLESVRSGSMTEADVNKAMQKLLFVRTEKYVTGGLSGLDPYTDKKEQQSIAEAATALLAEADFYVTFNPGLNDYFQNYPDEETDGTEEYLYWSLEKFGLKPTMRLQHAVSYQVPDDPQVDWVLAELGYYATHYFVISFSMSVFVHADLDGQGVANYVVVATRQLFDNEVKGLKRNSLNGKLQDGMTEQLGLERERLEASQH